MTHAEPLIFLCERFCVKALPAGYSLSSLSKLLSVVLSVVSFLLFLSNSHCRLSAQNPQLGVDANGLASFFAPDDCETTQTR